jgi:putative two-component system response regulator
MSKATEEKKIFVVDDNDTNLLTAEEALLDYYDVFTLPSAAGMFELLKRTMPDLILLDIEMPDMNGFEAINLLKTNPDYADIPVIFLTGKKDGSVEEAVFEMGAVDFITKPFFAPVLLKRIKSCLDLESLVRERTELANRQTDLANKRSEQLLRLQNSMISVLASMVENRDILTGRHVERTSNYVKLLLDTMLECGVYAEEIASWDIDLVVMSARLHDIGKITVSDLLLNKKGSLSPDEFEMIKTHALEGEDIIESIIRDSGEEALLHNARLFAGSHHERWNGMGYPRGLGGEEISLQGRIMALADVYDALVSERPYKKAFSHETAVEIITEERGKHFDPQIVDIFLKVSDKFAEVVKEA